MTSSSEEAPKTRKQTLVDVRFMRYDGSFIHVPLVMSGVANRLLRRVPKGRIRIKNAMGSSMVIATKLVQSIQIDGEERWRNQVA